MATPLVRRSRTRRYAGRGQTRHSPEGTPVLSPGRGPSEAQPSPGKPGAKSAKPRGGALVRFPRVATYTHCMHHVVHSTKDRRGWLSWHIEALRIILNTYCCSPAPRTGLAGVLAADPGLASRRPGLSTRVPTGLKSRVALGDSPGSRNCAAPVGALREPSGGRGPTAYAVGYSSVALSG